MEQHKWQYVAQTGNVDALYELLRYNPHLLEDIDKIPVIDTPMHIAASAGQTRFAIEIMSLKPSWSKKLNPDGMNPLDLAFRNRRFSTVEWLVRHDPELVRVKGRGRITPLHHVVDMDEVDLLEGFVSSCPESVKDLTIEGETAIHIAVRKRHVRALKVLLDCVERNKNELVLNWLDCRGDTVLHTAVAANDFEVVKMLLKQVDINTKNLGGLKAIDLTGDQSMKDILRNEEYISRSTSPKPKKSWLVKKSIRLILGPREQISSIDQIQALLVIAALIATATYQAIFNPPGTISSGEFGGGFAQIGVFYFVPLFMTVNTIAFLSSMTMIWLLLSKTNNRRLLKTSLVFLFASYGIGLASISLTGISIPCGIFLLGSVCIFVFFWINPVFQRVWSWLLNGRIKSGG